MNDINYFASIVKILENPSQNFFLQNKLMTKFRAQLPQTRNKKIVNLICWGNVASDVANYYKANDYIIIEGYVALPKQLNSKKVEITVVKVYPFVIGST